MSMRGKSQEYVQNVAYVEANNQAFKQAINDLGRGKALRTVLADLRTAYRYNFENYDRTISIVGYRARRAADAVMECETELL